MLNFYIFIGVITFVISCIIGVLIFVEESDIYREEKKRKEGARLILASPILGLLSPVVVPLGLLGLLVVAAVKLFQEAKLGELFRKEEKGGTEEDKQETEQDPPHYCINCSPKKGIHR